MYFPGLSPFKMCINFKMAVFLLIKCKQTAAFISIYCSYFNLKGRNYKEGMLFVSVQEKRKKEPVHDPIISMFVPAIKELDSVARTMYVESLRPLICIVNVKWIMFPCYYP